MERQIVRISSRNQVTLPRRIMDSLSGSTYFEVALEGEHIVLKPIDIRAKGETLAKVREKIRSLGITEDIIPLAVAETRKRYR